MSNEQIANIFFESKLILRMGNIVVNLREIFYTVYDIERMKICEKKSKNF